MQPTFDPVRKRKFWLDFNLAYETRFEPDEISLKGQAIYVSTLTNSLITAYLIGLADRVEPTLQAVIKWMESRPEPNVTLFNETWEHWRDGWHALYAWRRTLGVAKWLCGVDGAEGDFNRALHAEWEAWRQARPDDAARDFHLRREPLSEHLVLAIAAKNPGAGLQLRSDAGITKISADHSTLLFLGQWACLHLHLGNKRDTEFTGKAAKMLRRTLWPELLSQGRHTEALLWLKAIYWDSGMARSPEQAITRAYDFLPAVTRPDFVPR